jgi:hypothetical protein
MVRFADAMVARGRGDQIVNAAAPQCAVAPE